MFHVKLQEHTNSSLFLLIFTQHLDFLHQRSNSINTLAVSGKVVESQIDIEEILPFVSDIRQRLNLRQVDIIETQDGEHFGERTLVVRDNSLKAVIENNILIIQDAKI